jgi:hypothetical protein
MLWPVTSIAVAVAIKFIFQERSSIPAPNYLLQVIQSSYFPSPVIL